MINLITRIFELIGALLLLILLLPFFAIAVLIVQLDSSGPIIFHQKRVGKNGKVFTLHKLRTMRKDADGESPPHTQVDDQRFSAVCRLIRATGIDEVPQLWNIIKGDMGFIGPRPELLNIVETYSPNQKKILKFNPGLFGISQLALREGVNYRKKLKIENDYYPNRNVIKNFMIFFFTPVVLIDHTFGRILPFWKHRTEYTNTFWFKYLMPTNGNGFKAEISDNAANQPIESDKIHAHIVR
ncbi:sugar transferase [bacterium]|nr:sugar transferase [bacterium]